MVELFTQRANLYLLMLDPSPRLYRPRVGDDSWGPPQMEPADNAKEFAPTGPELNQALQRAIVSALCNAGYVVRGRVPQVEDRSRNVAPADLPLILIHPAYRLQVISFSGQPYLCINHHLKVRPRLNLAMMALKAPGVALEPDQRAWYRTDENWLEGRLLRADSGTGVMLTADGEEVRVSANGIVPAFTRIQIAQLAPALGVDPNRLEQTIKALSHLTTSDAARARLVACTDFAGHLATTLFPLVAGPTTIRLQPTSASLRPPSFFLQRDLVEAEVAFDHADRTKRTRDIRAGLSDFGAYDKPPRPLQLATLVLDRHASDMDHLVGRLDRGADRYQGARRTFGAPLAVVERLTATSVDEYERRLEALLHSGTAGDIDVVLVHLPRSAALADHRHPYFRVKRLLTQEGLASQMVDTATLLNPRFRDLNLALNLYAKAGYAPWVLDEAIDGADLFIGLSSSIRRRDGQIDRVMGYVNVFDAYGRWQFYQGDGLAFPFEERLGHYASLVRRSLARYRGERGGPLRSIHIHLTKPPSRREREVLAEAARAECPGTTVTFIWVDRDHPLRLYDLADGRQGRIDRATLLPADETRCYLTTTGSNEFGQPGMGTPIPLQLTVWTDPLDVVDLNLIAQQLLSLTRLNWASTRNFCQEPITTKFAGEIAYLMAAFMDDPSFRVSPRLRNRPWFL